MIHKEVNTALRTQKSSSPVSFSNSNGGGRDCLRRQSTSRGHSHRSQPLVASSAAGRQTDRLLHVTDGESRLCFLVDTGSEVRIIPPSKVKRKNLQDTCKFGLPAVNNSPTVTYRTCLLSLNLGLCHAFRLVFIVAIVGIPILGADFLKSYTLLVDMRRRRLLNTRT